MLLSCAARSCATAIASGAIARRGESLAIFSLCIYVIHGIVVYGDERVARGT